jgi:hypothetical protein
MADDEDPLVARFQAAIAEAKRLIQISSSLHDRLRKNLAKRSSRVRFTGSDRKTSYPRDIPEPPRRPYQPFRAKMTTDRFRSQTMLELRLRNRVPSVRSETLTLRISVPDYSSASARVDAVCHARLTVWDNGSEVGVTLRD